MGLKASTLPTGQWSCKRQFFPGVFPASSRSPSRVYIHIDKNILLSLYKYNNIKHLALNNTSIAAYIYTSTSHKDGTNLHMRR
jgi:hypothetical protein